MGMIFRLAAANSCEEDKRRADAVCTGTHDEQIINNCIARLVRGGTLQLLDGDYYIDAFAHEGNTAINFGYNDGNARVITIKGDTENKAYNTHYGAALHVTREALESLPEGETGRVFYGTGRKPDAPPDLLPIRSSTTSTLKTSIFSCTMRPSLSSASTAATSDLPRSS